MAREIKDTAYRVQTEVLSSEDGLVIEDGTLVTVDGKLKHQFNGESKEVVTERPAYINFFDFDSDLVTTITTADVYVKLNTDTTSSFSRDGLVHTNNKVVNTGTKKVFSVTGILSVSSGNNNQINVAFFKNGVLFPCSEQGVVTSLAGRVNAAPFHCLVELDTDDYIEIYVRNKLATTDISIDNVNVIIFEI